MNKILLACLLMLACSLLEPQPSIGQDATSAQKLVNFGRDIAPLFRERCLHCHEGEKASNGFLISDRAALLAFVEPGNASDSSLWNDYLNQPSKLKLKDSLVMPPDGPLAASELALLKVWIDEGADWPADASLVATNAEPSETGSISFSSRLMRAIGYFHPAVVHFPIVLFTLSGVAAFLSYFLGTRCRSAAFQCLAMASVSSIVAVIMGWSFADLQGYPAWTNALTTNATENERSFFMHRWLGTSTAILGVVLVVLGLLERRYKSNALGQAWRLGSIGMMFLIGLVGHQGGELVYGDIFEKAYNQISK